MANLDKGIAFTNKRMSDFTLIMHVSVISMSESFFETPIPSYCLKSENRKGGSGNQNHLLSSFSERIDKVLKCHRDFLF